MFRRYKYWYWDDELVFLYKLDGSGRKRTVNIPACYPYPILAHKCITNDWVCVRASVCVRRLLGCKNVRPFPFLKSFLLFPFCVACLWVCVCVCVCRLLLMQALYSTAARFRIGENQPLFNPAHSYNIRPCFPILSGGHLLPWPSSPSLPLISFVTNYCNHIPFSLLRLTPTRYILIFQLLGRVWSSFRLHF